MNAEASIGAFALGIDFALRDVQDELKRKGHPWLAAKGFRSSAAVTRFLPFRGSDDALAGEFALLVNGERAQVGRLGDMVFGLQRLLDECAAHFGLDEGDLLFTGTPAGVAAVDDGDRLELAWNGEVLGSCTVRLRAL